MDQTKPHDGHRQRLRHRFRNSGEQSPADYELLEFLLFAVLPRKDTKPIAKTLIERFGSMPAAISAPRERLKEVEGISDTSIDHLHAVHAAAIRYQRAQVNEKHVLDSWERLSTYLHTAMSNNTVEQFRVLFLDKRNSLIADEVQQTGTVDHTPVYPREIIKRALELSATALILVHNHPSGDPTPSKADIEMTKKIIQISEGLGIVIHDHIIVGKEKTLSFRSEGIF